MSPPLASGNDTLTICFGGPQRHTRTDAIIAVAVQSEGG